MGKLLNCQLLEKFILDFAQNTVCYRADPRLSRGIRGYPSKTRIFVPRDLEDDFGELKIVRISSIFPSGRHRVDLGPPR